MAEIYSGAYLTIAASLSFDSGRGLFSNSSPVYNCYEFLFTEESNRKHWFATRWSLPYIWLWDAPIGNEHPLLKQSWAFQERLLSPWLLQFTRDEMVWECIDKYACERSGEQRGSLPFPKLLFGPQSYHAQNINTLIGWTLYGATRDLDSPRSPISYLPFPALHV
jgi:hypothetical protein